MTTLKEVRAVGAELMRIGVMTGATMEVPRDDFDALAHEIAGLLFDAGAALAYPIATTHPLIVRTACGDISVSSPPGCEQVSTVYRTHR